MTADPPIPTRPALYTIGHSTHDAGAFVEMLRRHGIRTLVDVRRFPGSRRHPQFGHGRLEASLADASIAYIHEEALGGRRPAAPDSPNGAWRNPMFRGYADHMATPAFQEALFRVTAAGERAPTALMCAESVPWRCHRNLIADALVARGIPVLHILTPSRADPHALNPAARIDGEGRLTYPAGDQLRLPGT